MDANFNKQRKDTSNQNEKTNGTRKLIFELRDACVQRSSKTILHVDSFEFFEGESIALLGPNGAGKSTFIQLLTREILPLYKENPPFLFYGNARPTTKDIRKTLGVVSATMHDEVRVHLPVKDIVCGGLFGTLGLPNHVSTEKEDWDKTQQILKELGIQELSERDIMTLSTGQVRRALIAREMIRRPNVLVMDEPCTGLDPQGMYYVRKTMQTLTQQGVSLVLVTHYPEDIIPSINRVLLIKDAHIFADGAKEDILRSEIMEELFDVPLRIVKNREWYSLLSND